MMAKPVKGVFPALLEISARTARRGTSAGTPTAPSFAFTAMRQRKGEVSVNVTLTLITDIGQGASCDECIEGWALPDCRYCLGG